MDIDQIGNWVSSSGLKLNPTNTKLMVISRNALPSSHRSASVVTGQYAKWTPATLESPCLQTFLGQNILIPLTFKAKKHLGFIYHQFHSAGRRTISQLYKSTVLPLLDYCSCVWDVRKCAEVCSKDCHWSLVCQSWRPLYPIGMATPLQSEEVPKTLCHRILSGCSIISPESFIPHPSPNLRHSHNLPLYQPPTRTQAHLGYFPSVVPIWNSLPSDIVTSHSHLSFKHKLKSYLNL